MNIRFKLRFTQCSLAAILMVVAIGCRASEATVEQGVIEETGLRYWEWNADGVLFRLTQRLPDQTRAFLLARGFDTASADLAATSCMFQSMFRNVGEPGSGSVSIQLDDWIVHADEAIQRMRTRELWAMDWQQRRLPQSSRIAFEWALLPTVQTYEHGDYNWGMTSYGLKPGSHFDLEFNWNRNAKRYSGRLNDVVCPADIHPEPN